MVSPLLSEPFCSWRLRGGTDSIRRVTRRFDWVDRSETSALANDTDSLGEGKTSNSGITD